MMIKIFCSRKTCTLYSRLLSQRRAVKYTSNDGVKNEGQDKMKHVPLDMFSEEETMFKESARKFAEENIRPLVKQMDEEGRVPDSLVRALFDNGFFAVRMPEEFGGAGSSHMSLVLACEEICKVEMGVGTLVGNQNVLFGKTMRDLATPAQKEKYFRRICTSDIGAVAITESHAGSDAFAMKTTATKRGDYYILNGSKIFITSADIAKVFLILANVDPTKGYRGITTFIVERDTEGFTVGPPIDKLGIRSSGTCPLYLDNVKVHESDVLGEVGKSYKYILNSLGDGRIGTGTQGVAVGRACLEDVIKYITQRKQFGKRVWDFQAMQHQIADAKTRLEAARLLIYNAVRKEEAGLPYVIEASMAKYYATETMSYITSKSIDWMGGVGFTKDFPVEKYYRDCKIAQIYEGTHNIQLNTIAKFWENSGFPV